MTNPAEQIKQGADQAWESLSRRLARPPQPRQRRKQLVQLHRRCLGVMPIFEMSGLSNPAVRSAINRSARLPARQCRYTNHRCLVRP